MSATAEEVTDSDFKEKVLESELPVIVDMWAPWCGPCRFVSPVIDELAEQNARKIKTCKMNVDENQQTAQQYGISAIPSVLFFKNGQELTERRLVGVRPKQDYQQAMDEISAE